MGQFIETGKTSTVKHTIFDERSTKKTKSKSKSKKIERERSRNCNQHN